jgi:endonuclease III-like uncharacterized protein
MKKAIHQIAAEILAAEKKPMTAEEIYEIITSKGLYEFKAQSPKSVLKNQLRRHTANVTGAHQASTEIFTMSPDGRFSLK